MFKPPVFEYAVQLLLSAAILDNLRKIIKPLKIIVSPLVTIILRGFIMEQIIMVDLCQMEYIVQYLPIYNLKSDINHLGLLYSLAYFYEVYQ